MRAFVALLVVLGLSGCLAAPADLQKLELLKEKLASLHEVLDDLNKNIDNLESKASREFAPTPPPADPKDGELQKFVENLSPEDEELMEKMKSKLKYLQATVHEEPGVDIPAKDGYAEEQPAAPAEDEKRSMDPEMAAMYGKLSAEDQALLMQHPSAWSHFAKALRESGGDAADVVAENTRRENEEELTKLSADDKELLRRMKSKLNSLRSETSMVNEVEQRLLQDVKFAKENGVSLAQVLRKLAEAKRSV